MSGRQSAEASPGVVTSIFTVQSHDVFALIDPGSTLSYVTPYVAMEFRIEPKHLHESFFVSTAIGEFIIVARVYRDCVVMVRGKDTIADLIELGMVDFDVIIGMDWIYTCFDKLNCRTRTVRFEFPNEPVVEWNEDNVVMDTDAEAPILESVPGLNEFPDVFPDELPRIPPDKEIDFGINVIPVTQPILIPPYRITPAELKELKEQLKDFLGKGLIRTSVPPWGLMILFVRKKDGPL
ncbi:uncharacterized protein [Nicotiana sylvestris]|uniref:uncharacterized protein n=1 Tax=Nicotiana sylvestris TaxID=4096 RepID=UPI00388CBD19